MSLLRAERLSVRFNTSYGPVSALSDISLDVAPGEAVGILGESGSGKSVLCNALLGMVQRPGEVTSGRVVLDDADDLFELSREQIRRVRGARIGMIAQDAAGALTPIRRIGDLMTEMMTAHMSISRSEARERAIDYLGSVGIPAPAERLSAHPFELSGGMKQRLAIAISLCCEPEILIADDPTSAVDVTIQAQILKLLRDLKSEKNLSIVLVSQDPRVIVTMCTRVIVLYSGRVVEAGPVSEIIASPRHPYTAALLECAPTVDEIRVPLATVPGSPPEPGEVISGCAFFARCSNRIERCLVDEPSLDEAAGRSFACWNPTS